MTKGFYTALIYVIVFTVHVCAQQFDPNVIWKAPGNSTDGSFSNPAVYPLVISEDSEFNVTWTTTFQEVDVYLYLRGFQGSPGVYKNITSSRLKLYPDGITSEPWVFRVVKAQGNPLGSGGFWSTSIYVTKSENVANLTRFLSSQASASASTSAVSTRTKSTTIGQSTSASQTAHISVLPSTTPTPSGPSTEAIPPSLDSLATSTNKKNNTTIGLAVGLSIGIVLIIGLVAYFVKQRKAKSGKGKDTGALSRTVETTETQNYTPVAGAVTDLPVLANTSQAVEYQDEWVRD